MQFGTSLSSLTQSLIISLWFDPVDYHNYPSRGYHVVSCVDYIPHLLSVPYTLTKWYQEPGYDKQRQKTKDHFQNQYSKLVASRDKKVNQAARDYDDALALGMLSVKLLLVQVGLSKMLDTRPKEKINLNWAA
ncbi:hypothetical protein Tco_0015545 [Tanacetum coccineum]